MFFESLETRRLLTVTLEPPRDPGTLGSTDPGAGTPVCTTVTQDGSGKVTVSTKGGSKCDQNVSVLERNGTLVIVEEETLATWDVTGATAITILGTKKDDTIYYDGNTIGAIITGSDGNDSITVADNSTGVGSNVDAGKGNDSVNLLIGHGTTITGGDGNDVIYVNTDTENANIANATSIINAGNGDDFITTYEGDNTVNGGGGKDTLYDAGGLLTNNSPSSIEVFA